MTQLVPFTFDGQQVRVFEIDGESHFVGKDICDVLGYADHTNAMKQHCRGVVKRHPLQTPGGVQDVRVLTEADMMRLVVNSALPAAEKFERWVFEDVLPSIRRTGGYQMPTSSVDQSRINGALAIAECYARLLRPAPSSQVAMLASIAKDHGINPAFLPSYVVDAAPDATSTSSSMDAKSLSELLKEHKIHGGPAKFNELLAQTGFIREMTRKSSSSAGGTKRFWSITDEGLRYGKNMTSPQNPRETSPRWYVDRFKDLYSAVMERVGEAQV